jgi:hypothetical protein
VLYEVEYEDYDLNVLFDECGMSQHGDDEASTVGDGAAGQADAHGKHRVLTAVLKDALHPLNTEAQDMRLEVNDFFECLELYFMALGINDVEDGD